MLENVKQDIEEYIGVYRTVESDLELMLLGFVSKYGQWAYLQNSNLLERLKGEGLSEKDILKICLMTKVNGFKELLSKNEKLQQADLDRFVRNAVEETGFNRSVVMELTRAIMKSIGSVCDISKLDIEENTVNETAYVIPRSVYIVELNRFEQDFRKFQTGEKKISELNFARLEPLVAAGISKAKYYLGMCYLLLDAEYVDQEKACRLLKEAADAGDIEAAAALGDYYYKKDGSEFWSAAYDYYTGYGALALNKARRDAVTAIMNHKKFNLKMLLVSTALFIFLFALYIIAPASESFHAHYIWGAFCVILEVILLIAAWLHYKIKPYDNVLYVPFLMFIVWFCYMLIRLLF